MIRYNHQVLIESGYGTIESYCAISKDGVGMICMNPCENGEVGAAKPIDSAPEPHESAIVWTFQNIESLDVNIKIFNELRDMMEKYSKGELDFEEAT